MLVLLPFLENSMQNRVEKPQTVVTVNLSRKRNKIKVQLEVKGIAEH